MKFELKGMREVKVLETGAGSLFLEYGDGKRVEYKYREIITLIYLPSKSIFEKKKLSFFYWVRAGPWQTSKYIEFEVPDEKVAKKIAKEIQSHSVKMDPSVETLLRE